MLKFVSNDECKTVNEVLRTYPAAFDVVAVPGGFLVFQSLGA